MQIYFQVIRFIHTGSPFTDAKGLKSDIPDQAKINESSDPKRVLFEQTVFL